MDDMIRRYALLSITRGCGFGGLAIFTLMVGCASNLSLFLKAGGIATLLMCFILLYKAARTDHISVKSTEVWILLPREMRPAPEIAAPLIARARRDILLKFAYVAAIVASVELAADLVLTFRRII